MNHRTDPRTMEDRWRAMGWSVEWSDELRSYVVWATGADTPIVYNIPSAHAKGVTSGAVCRTVNEVEAYVTAHASGEVGK